MATAASVNSPRGMWIDSTGFLYFVEYGGNCIRGFSLSNNIVVNLVGVCGSAGVNGVDGGAASAASLNAPVGILVNTVGTIYIADSGSNRVRYLSGSVLRTYAGNGNTGSSGDGGYATAAAFDTPVYLAADTNLKLYVINNYDRVRVISTAGIVSLIAGAYFSFWFDYELIGGFRHGI